MKKYNLGVLIVIALSSSIQAISSSEVTKEEERYQRVLKISPPQQGAGETPISKPNDLKTTDRFKNKKYYLVGERVAYTDAASNNSTETKAH